MGPCNRQSLVRHRSKMAVVAGLIFGLVAGLPLPAEAHHDEMVDKLKRGTTSLVSMSSSGDRGNADSGTGCGLGGRYSASDDGRFVAFSGRAGNLHPADANGSLLFDVFVYDRAKRKLDLVSALPNGLAPEPPTLSDPGIDVCLVGSFGPAISGDGRFVAFVSNLPLTGAEHLPAEGAPLNKVFVRDLKKHTTELVSVTHNGDPAAGNSGVIGGWVGLSISDSGRFVAFMSEANNILEGACPDSELAPGVSSPLPSFCTQTYVRDLKKKETFLVSKSGSGEPANSQAGGPSISGNGRYVVFESGADNLVEGDANQCPQTPTSIVPPPPSCQDVFVHDLRSGQIELISISRDGLPGSDASWAGKWSSGSPTISDDGRFVLFHSKAPDIVPAHHHLYPVSWSGVYVRDRKTERTERVGVTSTGAMLQAAQYHTISDDGRHVLFNAHLMDDLYLGPVPDGGPYTPRDQGHEDRGTFLHDRETGQVDWALFDVRDGSQDGAPPGTKMFIGDIGGDGRFIVGASDRIDGGEPRDAYDVYVREIGNYPLGLGPLGGSPPSGNQRGQQQPDAGICVAPDVCVPPQSARSWRANRGASGALVEEGAELYGASLSYRPELGDLFAAIEIEHMGTAFTIGPVGIVAGGNPSLLYGLRFKVGGNSYEIRASSVLGGSFGLFDCTDSVPLCTKVASLRGGYGTTGERVVFSLPLRDIGLRAGGELNDVEAFSALGTIQTGATKVLDRVALK